jgi:hypothetical protein
MPSSPLLVELHCQHIAAEATLTVVRAMQDSALLSSCPAHRCLLSRTASTLLLKDKSRMTLLLLVLITDSRRGVSEGWSPAAAAAAAAAVSRGHL